LLGLTRNTEKRGGAETGIRLHVGNVDENSSQVDLALNGERVVVAAAGLFVRTAEHLQHVFIRLTLQLAEHALPSQNSLFLFRFI
jgi:hypothetical protein